jgi:hypothetical protein
VAWCREVKSSAIEWRLWRDVRESRLLCFNVDTSAVELSHIQFIQERTERLVRSVCIGSRQAARFGDIGILGLYPTFC